MKTTTRATIFALLAGVLGCQEDPTTTSSDKVDLDAADQEMALDPDGDGVAEGSVDGSNATMTFEFSEPLPRISEAELGEDPAFRSFDATEDAALADVMSALFVTVSSPRSGASATLSGDGNLVASPPYAPGEWSAILDDSRKVLTLQWYNGTQSGLTMKPGLTYDVVWSLGQNCCVKSIPDTLTQYQGS